MENNTICIAISIETSGESLKNNAIIQIIYIVFSLTKKKIIEKAIWDINLDDTKKWDSKFVEKGLNESDIETYTTKKKLYDKIKDGDGTNSTIVALDLVQRIKNVGEKYGSSNVNIMVDNVSADCSFINYFLDSHDLPPLHKIFGYYKDVICSGYYIKDFAKIKI
ncbi:hypothetical protein EON71_00480 [bacterium]|nr:MAG: hypothetical protein EON71_00480 [bacterium]